MMTTVPHVTSGLAFRKFQADGFLLTRVYKHNFMCDYCFGLIKEAPLRSPHKCIDVTED